jgi:hypothetical protein
MTVDTKFLPFIEGSSSDLSQPNLRANLFGDQTDNQVFADFISWIEVGHSGPYLDLELIDDSAQMLAAVGCIGLDSKLVHWYASNPSSHNLAILSASLDGYWKRAKLSDETIINRVIDAIKENVSKAPKGTGYASALWTIFKVYSQGRFHNQISEQTLKIVEHFINEEKANLIAEGKLLSCAPWLA